MKFKKIRVVILIFLILIWLNVISENSYDNFMRDHYGVTIENHGSHKMYDIQNYGEFRMRSISSNHALIFETYTTTFTNSEYLDEKASITFKHFKFAGINVDYTDKKMNDRFLSKVSK